MKQVPLIVLLMLSSHLFSSELTNLSQVFELPHHTFDRPVLVTAIESIGPKAVLAQQWGRYDVVGKDVVAKCMNEIASQGATPLFFVDHSVAEKNNIQHSTQRIAGIAAACKESGCQLLASKDTQLHDATHPNRFYTTGFAVGMANHAQLFATKNSIHPGDVIIGLPSNGLHLSGYSALLSLIQELHLDLQGKTPFASSHQTLIDALLTPAAIYAKPFTFLKNKEYIKAAIHIASDGISSSVASIIPDQLTASLNMHGWYIPPLFRWLKKIGQYTDQQLADTFNLGIAMACIVEKSHANNVLESLAQQGVRATIIGSIEAQSSDAQVQLKGTIGSSKIRLLIIGSSPRENALAEKMAESPFVELVHIAPGNSGSFRDKKIKNIRINSLHVNALIVYAQQNNIDLVVVGPSAPVELGIVDEFAKSGVPCFGPSKQAARIETSKIYAKEFMQTHSIPTPAYTLCTTLPQAEACIASSQLPLVIKADGLAAGKGVVIAHTKDEAHMHAQQMLATYGPLLIEEHIEGEKVNITVISDGETILSLPTCQQYHTGANRTHNVTKNCCPAPIITPVLHKLILSNVIEPAIQGLRAQGEPFAGFLYAGILVTPDNGIKVLEFNCHLKDREAQSVMSHLKTDLFILCNAAYNKQLDLINLDWAN